MKTRNGCFQAGRLPDRMFSVAQNQIPDKRMILSGLSKWTWCSRNQADLGRQLKWRVCGAHVCVLLHGNTFTQHITEQKQSKGQTRRKNEWYDSNKDTKQWKLVTKPQYPDSQMTQRQIQRSSGAMLTSHPSVQTWKALIGSWCRDTEGRLAAVQVLLGSIPGLCWAFVVIRTKANWLAILVPSVCTTCFQGYGLAFWAACC